MKIRTGFDIAFDSGQPTPMILMLSVHPSRAADLRTPGYITFDPFVPSSAYRDGFGNTCTRIVAPPGRLTIATDFLVEDSGLPDDYAPDAEQVPVEHLPDDALAPAPGDHVLVKHRYSAFQRSNLEQLMRVRGRDQLLITGVYAHIGLLSTATEAFQRDIETFVAADAVADFSRADHDMALHWIARTCGVPLTTDRLLEMLQ